MRLHVHIWWHKKVFSFLCLLSKTTPPCKYSFMSTDAISFQSQSCFSSLQLSDRMSVMLSGRSPAGKMCLKQLFPVGNTSGKSSSTSKLQRVRKYGCTGMLLLRNNSPTWHPDHTRIDEVQIQDRNQSVSAESTLIPLHRISQC